MKAIIQVTVMGGSAPPSSPLVSRASVRRCSNLIKDDANCQDNSLVAEMWNEEEVDRHHIQIYNDAPFAGYYEDVVFPVCTLFTPPQAPGIMPAPVKILREPKVWLNDLSRAGITETNAQCTVGRVWRGVLCRRQLYNDRAYEKALFQRACKIQQWWRILRSRRQRNALESMIEEWLTTQAQQYLTQQLRDLASMQRWQRHRLDNAASTIQRAVRWFIKNQVAKCQLSTAQLSCATTVKMNSSDSTDTIKPFGAACSVRFEHTHGETVIRYTTPFSIKDVLGIMRPKRPYFPWRGNARAVEKNNNYEVVQSDGNNINNNVVLPTQSRRVRTILKFKSIPDPDVPVLQEVVEKVNMQERARDRVRERTMADPNIRQRLLWKKEGLRHDNFDFNLSIIQRLYRSRVSAEKRTTRQLSTARIYKTVNIIVRAFRMYCLIKRMQSMSRRAELHALKQTNLLSSRKIAALHTDAVWGKELMDRCATEIQRCWRYHYFTTYCPASQQGNNTYSVKQIDKSDLHSITHNDDHKKFLGMKNSTCNSRMELQKCSDAPPYHLIDAHRKRVTELRWSTMSQQERFQYDVAKKHKCAHFKPAKTILHCRNNIFLS